MARYLLIRLVRWIIGITVILFITYAMMYYGAGDPVRRIYMSRGDSMMYLDQNMVQALREKYGLDRSFTDQFVTYVSNLLKGDFGNSFKDSYMPISSMIRVKLAISMQLGLVATLIVAVVGIPLGVVAALRHNKLIDNVIVGTAASAHAIPQFVSAPLLMLFVVLGLHLMDVPYGWKGILNKQIILPVFVLAMGSLQTVIRQTRAGMLEALGSDYVRTARAKGLPEKLVVSRHMLRPVLIPVVTSIGLIMIGLVNGAIYVETIFNIPGFGQMTVAGIQNADYPVIMATVLIGALIVMVSNLLVDLIYPLLDPRITRS
jgi:peptide/nickel transport system permease protein